MDPSHGIALDGNWKKSNSRDLGIHCNSNLSHRWSGKPETMVELLKEDEGSCRRFSSVTIHNESWPKHWPSDWTDMESFWLGIARMIGVLPNCEELIIRGFTNIILSGVAPTSFATTYDKCISFLLQQPELECIKSLSIRARNIEENNIPLICKQIGQMKNLRHVKISRESSRYGEWDFQNTYKILADSLEGLPNLETFRFNVAHWSDAYVLQDLVEVLRNKSSLQKVDLGNRVRLRLTREQRNAIETFPTIHQAMKQHRVPTSILQFLNPSDQTMASASSSSGSTNHDDAKPLLPADVLSQPGCVQNFIDGFAALNDRFDCFHILFSCLAPTLCAHAIRAVTPPPIEPTTTTTTPPSQIESTTTTTPVDAFTYVPKLEDALSVGRPRGRGQDGRGSPTLTSVIPIPRGTSSQKRAILSDPSLIQKLKDALSVGQPRGRGQGGRGSPNPTSAVIPIPREKRAILWDPSFIQNLKDALTVGRAPRSGSVIAIRHGTIQLLADETTKRQKWIQGLSILLCRTLPDVASLDCSSLFPCEIILLLCTVFPFLQEAIKYTYINPFKMPDTINSLQAAQSSVGAPIWPRFDTRSRPGDRVGLVQEQQEHGGGVVPAASSSGSVAPAEEATVVATTTTQQGKKRPSPSPSMSRREPCQEEAIIPGDNAVAGGNDFNSNNTTNNSGGKQSKRLRHSVN